MRCQARHASRRTWRSVPKRPVERNHAARGLDILVATYLDYSTGSSMKAAWTLTIATTLLTLGSVVAFAQQGTSRELVIAHVEGTVVFDGVRLEPSAAPFPLTSNSVVHTENGRVEIILASGD